MSEGMRIIEIQWEDSGSGKDIWTDRHDYCNEPGLCKTVGYLVEKNKDAYVIAQSDGDTQLGHVFVIPLRSVSKTRYL